MAPRERMYVALSATGLALAAASLAVVLLVYAAIPKKKTGDLVDTAKMLAGELADNNLPQAAIEEYQRVLDIGILTNSERGAIHYLMGDLYFNDVGDYEQAAAHYVRARALDEDAPYNAEAGKKLITCLERLGRRQEAQRELDVQANLNPDTTKTPGKLVAKVGSTNITLADFEQAIDKLPKEMQDKLSDPKAKRKFLDQMIGRELIYHAALREGLDKEAEAQQTLKDIEKDYLVQYYTQQKIAPTVKPDSAEVMLYYNAHKSDYDNKDFADVRDKVLQDYVQYIGQKAINDYIATLMKAEPVHVFEENVK
jgi:tetratricopeptide (TPR) repeat protein